MQRDTDSSDTLTLERNSCLKITLTIVRIPLTLQLNCQRIVNEVSRVVSVKCQCVESCVIGVKCQ